ncbi:MAG: hypothetical protein EOP82_29770 [Variovorax sp.]|nr:MAG: hypothetical protein EOP82_29770 [Variovorax sp.]
MVGANMSKVNLGGARFQGANLSGATLSMPSSEWPTSDTNGFAWGHRCRFSSNTSSGQLTNLSGATSRTRTCAI